MEWERKAGYETLILAVGAELESDGTEIQLVRFRAGKDAHYHRRKTEFFYFISGEGEAFVDGERRPLSPGAVLIIPPGTRHAFIASAAEEPLEALMVKTNSNKDDTFRD